MDYLAFSPEYLYQMAGMLRDSIGTIFDVALYAFVLVLSIYAIIHIVHSLGQ